MIVDINSFAIIADVLDMVTQRVQANGGIVTNCMGDALLVFFPKDSDNVWQACLGVAKEPDKLNDYIRSSSEEGEPLYGFMPTGLGLKISLELGTVYPGLLNRHSKAPFELFTSTAINYAARIATGKGNRCHIGPNAAESGMFP
jgi:class 3 adenylate cyclase